MDYYAAYSWPEPHRQYSNKARAFSLKWNLITLIKSHNNEGNQSSLFTAVSGSQTQKVASMTVPTPPSDSYCFQWLS